MNKVYWLQVSSVLSHESQTAYGSWIYTQR